MMAEAQALRAALLVRLIAALENKSENELKAIFVLITAVRKIKATVQHIVLCFQAVA